MILRVTSLKDFRSSANALSVTGNGTAWDLGAPASSQYIYGLMHLMVVSTGRTLVMKIQSATSSGFTAATDRFTFSLTSAVGATMPTRLTNVSTDSRYWRASWTLSTAALSTAGSWQGITLVSIEDNPLR